MNKFFHFFSIALLTQLVLMLSQLILLPMQIRLWGHATTAEWYAALALANVTTVLDFGLRTAGHSELHEHVTTKLKISAAGEQFRQIWSWVRLLVVTMTILLIAAQATFTLFFQHAPYPLWKIAIILASSVETILIIRIVYLDTLGFYRGSEASYLFFAALRLLLSVPAILIFHFGVNWLAFLFLLSALLGLSLQGVLLCRNLEPLKLFAPIPKKLSLKVMLLSRLTVAEPFANWVRLNLPVVVISAIAPPAAVTTFVGLRAAMGAARTTIQQLSRVASVECLHFRAQGRNRQAGNILFVSIIVASMVATLASVAIVTDNMRLMGMWLMNVDRSLYQNVSLAFVLSAPFYAYQIPLNLMFRLGELGWIARRHYLYATYSCMLALAAWMLGQLVAYLIMLACSEVAMSISFMLVGKQTATKLPAEATRALQFCVSGSMLALALWLIVRANLLPFLTAATRLAAVETVGFAVLACGILAAFDYAANPQMARLILPFLRRQPVIRPNAA